MVFRAFRFLSWCHTFNDNAVNKKTDFFFSFNKEDSQTLLSKFYLSNVELQYRRVLLQSLVYCDAHQSAFLPNHGYYRFRKNLRKWCNVRLFLFEHPDGHPQGLPEICEKLVYYKPEIFRNSIPISDNGFRIFHKCFSNLLLSECVQKHPQHRLLQTHALK